MISLDQHNYSLEGDHALFKHYLQPSSLKRDLSKHPTLISSHPTIWIGNKEFATTNFHRFPPIDSSSCGKAKKRKSPWEPLGILRFSRAKFPAGSWLFGEENGRNLYNMDREDEIFKEIVEFQDRLLKTIRPKGTRNTAILLERLDDFLLTTVGERRCLPHWLELKLRNCRRNRIFALFF